MANIIKTVQHGTRRVAGTDFPIESWVERTVVLGLVRWALVRYCCDGTPEAETLVFRTRKAALARLDEMV